MLNVTLWFYERAIVYVSVVAFTAVAFLAGVGLSHVLNELFR